jgi:hypothetical protein
MSSLNNPSTAADNQAATQAALNQTINSTPSELNAVGAIVAGTTVSLGILIAPSQKNRKLTLTNNNTAASNKRFKFALQAMPVAANAAYAAYSDHYLGELIPGGSMEIGDPEIRLGVWGWCSDPAGGAIDTVFSVIP